MFVYLITNDVNGKIYVGKTTSSKLQQYLQKKFYVAYRPSSSNSSSHLYAAIRKYGREHFHICPLITDCETNEALCAWECVLIKLLGTRDPEIGYNICHGGEGFTGKHSQASRDKIAEASRQMWERPGTRENFRCKRQGHSVSPNVITALKRRKGTKASQETITKLQTSHTGLRRSQDSRDKQRQSTTGEKNHFHGKQHSEQSRLKMRESAIRAIAEGRRRVPPSQKGVTPHNKGKKLSEEKKAVMLAKRAATLTKRNNSTFCFS